MGGDNKVLIHQNTSINASNKSQGKLSSSPLGALASKLILKMRMRFGDAASDNKAQEIITTEVLDFMSKAKTAKVRFAQKHLFMSPHVVADFMSHSHLRGTHTVLLSLLRSIIAV